MAPERDLLCKFTFPALRKLCESRGIAWGEVDLRWGITDEQVAEGAVLPVCLAEIDRCRPYFIGLLGERYGWMLPDHAMRSVTELEIAHGVLDDPAMYGRAYFYFRDPSYLDRLPPGSDRCDFASENQEAARKLRALKERIREAAAEGRCRLREGYADPEQASKWVREDFTTLIATLFPPSQHLSPLDREDAEHQAFAQSRMRVYAVHNRPDAKRLYRRHQRPRVRRPNGLPMA